MKLLSWTDHCKKIIILTSSRGTERFNHIPRRKNVRIIHLVEFKAQYLSEALDIISKIQKYYDWFLIIREESFIFVLKLLLFLHQEMRGIQNTQKFVSLHNEDAVAGCMVNNVQMDQLRKNIENTISKCFFFSSNKPDDYRIVASLEGGIRQQFPQHKIFVGISTNSSVMGYENYETSVTYLNFFPETLIRFYDKNHR